MSCLFGHKWAWHDAVEVEIYAHSTSTRPTRVETEVSGACVRCGAPRVKTISGRWIKPGGAS